MKTRRARPNPAIAFVMIFAERRCPLSGNARKGGGP
jgi:hypothetical protein